MRQKSDGLFQFNVASNPIRIYSTAFCKACFEFITKSYNHKLILNCNVCPTCLKSDINNLKPENNKRNYLSSKVWFETIQEEKQSWK